VELNKAIRIGYASALSSISAPIYDAYAIPEQASYPYVLIGSQTNVQRVVKRTKIYDATVTVDIVTGSQETIGRSQSEDIAEEIENIITPDTFTDLNIEANGYKIGDTIKISDNYITSKNDVNYVYRKIITFKHIISKL